MELDTPTSDPARSWLAAIAAVLAGERQLLLTPRISMLVFTYSALPSEYDTNPIAMDLCHTSTSPPETKNLQRPVWCSKLALKALVFVI